MSCSRCKHQMFNHQMSFQSMEHSVILVINGNKDKEIGKTILEMPSKNHTLWKNSFFHRSMEIIVQKTANQLMIGKKKLIFWTRRAPKLGNSFKIARLCENH